MQGRMSGGDWRIGRAYRLGGARSDSRVAQTSLTLQIYLTVVNTSPVVPVLSD
jgi:hypothetical protein